MIRQLNINNIVCKYCNSKAVVKFGTYESKQRYWCKSCKRKFIANDSLFNMKTPANQVSSAVDMFYRGMSINDIRQHLRGFVATMFVLALAKI